MNLKHALSSWKIPALSAAIVFIMLSACSRQPVYPPPSVIGQDVVIEIDKLEPEAPLFFTYRYQEKNINFFVVKMKDKVLSFLDACASCYPHKKGYRSADECVTCRECNMKFSIHQLEKGLGGCYPIQIQGRTVDGKYHVPVSTLQKAANKF